MLELSDKHFKADRIITLEMHERIERLSKEIESPSKGIEDAKKNQKEIFSYLFLFLFKKIFIEV